MTGITIQQRIEKKEKKILDCEQMIRHSNWHIKRLQNHIEEERKENHPERDARINYDEGLIEWNQVGIVQFEREIADINIEIAKLREGTL